MIIRRLLGASRLTTSECSSQSRRQSSLPPVLLLIRSDSKTEIMETPIVQCLKCGTKNSIQLHSDGVRPICGRCGATLTPGSDGSQIRTPRKGGPSNPAVCVLLLVLLGCTVYGIFITSSLLKKDFSALASKEAEKTVQVRKQHEQRLTSRRATLETEVSAIDAAALRRSAFEQYKQELANRESYDKRFALSSRERAQLHMQALASDSTRSFHDAIRAVAQEASPKGADIDVRESSRGIALHIDFDMSSMTSGEHGTRTKHHTKESLRKEVISLISRVTNDIFQFCKDFELTSIHVGCRHVVRTKYQYGATWDENTVLYKIRIQKNRVQELKNDPFLDVYSTTSHFEVEVDNFENIEIITTNI
jgi:ribosomal protein S27AE